MLDVPNETITESVEVWENNYINKYQYNERNTYQRGTVTPFKVYDLCVDNDIFSIIPRS